MTDSTDPREINKLLAEFMGWTELEWKDAGTDGVYTWPEGWYGNHPTGAGYLAADYAHSVDNLIPVIERLREGERYINISAVGRKSFAADLYDKCDGWLAEETAETMARAVCLAIIEYLESDE